MKMVGGRAGAGSEKASSPVTTLRAVLKPLITLYTRQQREETFHSFKNAYQIGCL